MLLVDFSLDELCSAKVVCIICVHAYRDCKPGEKCLEDQASDEFAQSLLVKTFHSGLFQFLTSQRFKDLLLGRRTLDIDNGTKNI